MHKVSVIVVIYNAKKYIRPVFEAVLAQTHKDLELIAVINGNDDGSKEMIEKNYSAFAKASADKPQVKIIDPGRNTWFAEGNNLGIKASIGEFVQLVNQDLILEPDYIEKLLRSFLDPQVGAATGKLLRYDFSAYAQGFGGSAVALSEGGEKNQKTNIIDSTGVVMSASGRARDRGQNQVDQNQFQAGEVFGVSGAGPMYRRSALESVKWCEPSTLLRLLRKRLMFQATNNLTPEPVEGSNYCEYFDQDFVAYWEDVDLSWRLNRAGFKNVYVPGAVAYHGRTAGQSKGGYWHFWHFIKHHSKLSTQIRRLNYKNHILMYIKNAPFIFHPAFLLREIVMLGYIFLFEISTLKIFPELIRQIPRALRKRAQKSSQT